MRGRIHRWDATDPFDTVGPPGSQGPQGAQGSQGTQGNQGATGSQGTQGAQGLRGFQGFQGNQGFQGATGAGAQGTQGFQGTQGLQGFQGAQGGQGATGTQGFQGFQGLQGAQGAQGARGPATGVPFTFSTSTSATDPGAGGLRLSATHDEIYLSETDAGGSSLVGLLNGITANTTLVLEDAFGNLAAYTVLTVTDNGAWRTLSVAPLHETGTVFPNGAAVGLLAIQRGAAGAQGAQGNQGAAGAQGAAGSQGNQGFQGNQGATGAQGSQGHQGTTGSQGNQGVLGSQGVQGLQGHQGFQGPQGAQGAQGAQGSQGVQGDQGTQGFQGSSPGVPFAYTTTTSHASVIPGQWGFSFDVVDAIEVSGLTFEAEDASTLFTVTDAGGWVVIRGEDSGAYYLAPVVSATYDDVTDPLAPLWTLVLDTGTLNTNVDDVPFLEDELCRFLVVPAGADGPQGEQGSQGTQGNQGVPASIGAQGPQGNQGVQGAGGVQGAQGNQGLQGTTGVQGVQGAAGVQGSQGEQGFHGVAAVPAGVPWLYDDDHVTNADPGFGFFQVDDWLALGEIAVSTSNAAGNLQTDYIEGLEGGLLHLGTVGDFAGTVVVRVVTATEDVSGDWYVLDIERVAGSVFTEPADGQTVGWVLAERGLQGAQGFQGAGGAQGSQGNQGFQGATGSTGSQGTQGLQGATGSTGTQGNQGFQGTQGLQGATGSTGTQGNQGFQGTQGLQGATGSTGTQGNQGFQGTQGLQGATGSTGSTGNQGNQGFQGLQGAQGFQGTQGVQGTQGRVSGVPYTYAASTTMTDPSAGNLRFNHATLTSATQLVIAETDAGAASQIAWLDLIGIGTQLQFSTDAGGLVEASVTAVADSGTFRTITITAVTVTGSVPTTSTLRVELIPRGATGAQGTQGFQGNQGLQGATGSTGNQGTQGNQGFQGTQGTQGNQGFQGNQGVQGAGIANAVVGPSVCSANVNLSGTTNQAITGFSLAIPAGGTTADKWLVLMQFDVTTTTNGGQALAELLVDGSVSGATITPAYSSTDWNRTPGMAHFIVTGLSSAAHTITARARMGTAGHTGVVNQTSTYGSAIRLI